MILATLGHPELEDVVRRAALPGEQILTTPSMVLPATLFGFPRVAIVWDATDPCMRVLREAGIPILDLARLGWARRTLRSSSSEITDIMRGMLEAASSGPTWVDRLFIDLSRASGQTLPEAFRIFARRPLEYPRSYRYAADLAKYYGLTGGAFKERFTRVGVSSPGGYLKWFRLFAAAHVLQAGADSTTRAAYRLGYASGGSLCRAMQTLGGVRTVQLRRHEAWPGLVMRFSSAHLRPQDLEGWRRLERMFVGAA